MDEESLKKFIDFTKNLLISLQEDSSNSWFFEEFDKEIISNFFSQRQKTDIDKLQNITESDIQRIKAYLKFIDKKAYNYGKIFYKDILDKKLKKQLISDFKEMKIALQNDNIIEFGRRLYLQIENIFNFSLSKLNVHDLIKNNKSYYKNVDPKWDNQPQKRINLYNSFFFYDKELGLYKEVELSKISFRTKSMFLYLYFNYKVNYTNLNDIYFLRNKGSHRGEISEEDMKKLNRILTNFDKNYSYYYKLLFDIVQGIKNI